MPKHIVILGAGLSGLSTAWFLKQRFGQNIKLTVLEKDSRAGGWIRTIHHKGFLFELGPHSCRINSACLSTLNLIEELNLLSQVIPGAPSARNRYLYTNKKLTKIPGNPLSLLFSPFGKSLLKGLWKDLWTPKSLGTEESVHDFFSRRFGSFVADIFIDALISGIYAGDSTQLSMQACFPALVDLEQQYGGILWGLLRKKRSSAAVPLNGPDLKKARIFSFKEGMEVLPLTLASRLQAEVKLSCSVKRMEFDRQSVEVELQDGSKIAADHVISALPGHALGELISCKSGHSLKAIPYASVAVVSLGYARQVQDKEGFGYLIPVSEQQEILGVIWDSSVFPQQNLSESQTRLTVMIGGTRMKGFDKIKDEEFIAKALFGVARHMNVAESPDVMHVHRAQAAIPQYVLGHGVRLRKHPVIETRACRPGRSVFAAAAAIEAVPRPASLVISPRLIPT